MRLSSSSAPLSDYISALNFSCLISDTMANLEQWVNDRLHDILGLSDRYVSQFMIGTARKASSAQDFVTRLEQTGTIDIDQSVIAFAQDLYDRIPRKQVVEKPSREIERQAIEMEKKIGRTPYWRTATVMEKL
ncbi:hypothetical protein Q5P01_011622 [Channa striata]|uniref:Uncharacterized protein n=1 Tax=Channa striata TaxID=64152 RepID=A0AA88STK6_CHASR|nr:hypothetical protein Q5P01_011622 [Channa striata]